MSNPLEDFVSEYGVSREKTAAPVPGGAAAFFNRYVAPVGSGFLGGMGTAAAAAAVAGVSMAATKMYNATTKLHDFKNMLKYNPDLVEHHQRDPKMFNQMYSSLRNMNPAFSKDPLVAGTYMRRMSENPLTAGGILTETVGHRGAFRTMLEDSLTAGASGAAKAYGERVKSNAGGGSP
jgi:hypothetical protein